MIVERVLTILLQHHIFNLDDLSLWSLSYDVYYPLSDIFDQSVGVRVLS